jgi:hypothetical protein
MGARVILAVFLAALILGCTSTGQRFVERTYSPPDASGDQWILDETVVKNRSIAPPFGSRADSTHNFQTVVNGDGSYTLTMGSIGQLEGGEIASAIQALAALVEQATKLVATLEGVPAPLLEPLTTEDEP